MEMAGLGCVNALCVGHCPDCECFPIRRIGVDSEGEGKLAPGSVLSQLIFIDGCLRQEPLVSVGENVSSACGGGVENER